MTPLAGGWDHAGLAKVIAETGRGHQDIVSGRVKHALGPESPPPVEHERPRVDRQRSSGMISDQQRGLRGESLPTGRLKAEVVLAQDIPDRLLSPHQCLVGALERVFGSRCDPEMVAMKALFLRRGEPHLLNGHSHARSDQQTGECAADNARHTLSRRLSKRSNDPRFTAPGHRHKTPYVVQKTRGRQVVPTHRGAIIHRWQPAVQRVP